MKYKPTLSSMVVSCFAVVFSLAVSETAASGIGRCISVTSTTPIITPDGTSHDAGTLEICLRNKLGPAIGVHSLSIDGKKLGNFMSRLESIDGAGSSDFIQMRELASGGRLFEGYAVSAGRSMQGYRMQMRLDGQKPFYPRLQASGQRETGNVVVVHDSGG